MVAYAGCLRPGRGLTLRVHSASGVTEHRIAAAAEYEDVPLTVPARPAFRPYPTPPKGPEEPK